MSDTSFEHHGHQVTIEVWPTGDRWSWSFQIDDREPVRSRDAGARSEEEALIESRHEAIAAIRDLDAGP
ncbi:hypothetical protein [Variovorax saccharolyticus]|uniref:hypothetical protein n=1 Tax=Variovorax saccharolyticus TaxID=3053516 RepID=UPI0025764738|nr:MULTISPECIES: hypothetical protein [unclassified Variovorax]MDM0022894.1 hypothetical protein [Variovorax sp. J22R187]MDM0030308.1 hypothetical protein [Variovorax sp. J31P216]